MSCTKKRDNALWRIKEAILKFGRTLKREDEEAWEFYRQIKIAFNEMMAKTRLACGCL